MDRKTETDALLLQFDAPPRAIRARATLYEDTGLEPELAELRRLIDCERVELVRLPLGDLWIDEESLLKNRPVNANATLICQTAGIETIIAGDAVFIPRTERALTQVQEFSLSRGGGWSHGFGS